MFNFLSNLFSTTAASDDRDRHLHFPLMLGDGKVDITVDDRSQVVKELKATVNALKEETSITMVNAILNRKAQKASKFNLFLYMDENKEFHVIDYGQGIPATVKNLKVHKKTGEKTKKALQDLKEKAKTQAASLKDLKAEAKAIEEKILNLPYGVSPYALEQKLKQVNKAIKAKEAFKAKKAKGKAKDKSSNMEFLVGDISKLRGRNGSALVNAIKTLALLKGYNRVVLKEKAKKAYFYKIEGSKTPEVYTEATKANRKALSKKATKQGMLDWSRA